MFRAIYFVIMATVALYIGFYYQYGSTETHTHTIWEHTMAQQYADRLGKTNISKVLVINLDRRIDRMTAINMHLGDVLGATIERLSAVDGRLIKQHNLVSSGIVDMKSYQTMIENSVINGELMTIGGLGCYLSHVNAWKVAASMQSPTLIFEDDITPGAAFNLLGKVIKHLPKDFGMLYLVNMVGEKITHTFTDCNDLICKMNGEQWGTSAYLISPAAASLLLSRAFPARQQVDSYIIEICAKYKVPVFITKENLVTVPNTYGRDSDVQRYKRMPVSIPKIFHRVWYGKKELGSDEIKYGKMLASIYPDWEIIMWTEPLIRKIGLSLQPLIDRVNITAAKSDITRYELLYKFGGVYIDTDVQPVKNIENIIGGVDVFVGYEDRKLACNAIIGAVPNHDMLGEIVRDIEDSWNNPKNININRKTGPNFFTKYVEKYQEKIRTFAPHIFYPYLWNETDPGTYGRHTYMVHHWNKQWWKEVGWK